MNIPTGVDPRFRLDLSRFFHSEFDIGKFRDVGHLVGVNRFNQAGGAIMEDFDNDGLLDIAVTSFDPTQPMSYLPEQAAIRRSRTARSEAGVTDQLGGLVCYQTDYDNDGRHGYLHPARGMASPADPADAAAEQRHGRFIDVTREAGLLDPVNSNAAAWADYDNDGWLDLFIGCEKQTNRLYHNKGNGTFEEVAARAGVQGDSTRLLQGMHLDRLRQRRLSRPVPQ